MIEQGERCGRCDHEKAAHADHYCFHCEAAWYSEDRAAQWPFHWFVKPTGV